MSRHGFSDDCDDQWQYIMWRGAVTSAIRGKRGQALLKEILGALDAMPVKRLVAESLVEDCGGVCTFGALAQKRGMDVSNLDPEDYYVAAKEFGVNEKLFREIVYMNDEGIYVRSDWDEKQGRYVELNQEAAERRRWHYIRDWVASQIKEAPCAG